MYILMAVFCALCVFFDMKNDRIPNPLTAVFFCCCGDTQDHRKGNGRYPVAPYGYCCCIRSYAYTVWL